MLTGIKSDHRFPANISLGRYCPSFQPDGGQLTQANSTSRSESISLRRISPSAIAASESLSHHSIVGSLPIPNIKVPHYLAANYWWAYVHPGAVWVFERQWLVNLILWGNYTRLRNAAMIELGDVLPGATLQVACVYGDLTSQLNSRVAAGGGRIDIVDVLPLQLGNLRRKLPSGAPARLLAMDSADLNLPDASYDRALLFFLLHEQPGSYRERTLSEVFRVVRPGGKIVIVDYALPRWWHPLRYLWQPLLAVIEPFALDLWRHEIAHWLPVAAWAGLRKQSLFGGLYQKVVITR
jgi:Methylase involved in ubiquinone/menaquinone biosynthesis